MECRSGCGACCIAPSISSPIPGMPAGKPANVRCIHLNDEWLCDIFFSSERPKVCGQLQAVKDMCLSNRDEALTYLISLEQDTLPD